MSRPETIWHLEWQETYRDQHQERRYRSVKRCAEQLASILAAPDDIARLKGLWRTVGWDTDRLAWDPVDPSAFLEETVEAQGEGIDITERYETLIAIWREHDARERA